MENLDPTAARMMQQYAQQQQQHHHHSAYLGGGMDPSAAFPQSHNPHDHGGVGIPPPHDHHSGGGGAGAGGPMDGSSSGMRGGAGHVDISTILDQIMNITDQSLDEAQVLF